MSKPLELTVHEIDRADPSMVVVKGFWEYRPYDPEKRLTDAELAAEYWNLNYFGSGAQFNEASSGDPYSEEFWESHYERLDALYGFATLPHYDEVV